MNENIYSGRSQRRGNTGSSALDMMPSHDKPLKRDIRFRPTEIGEIRQSIIDIHAIDELSWILIDTLAISYALGWNINNRHTAFEKIAETINLQNTNDIRDYKVVDGNYLLSEDTGVDKTITFLSKLIGIENPEIIASVVKKVDATLGHPGE